MWQDEIEETNSSSGLYLDLSPKNEGSEEPSMKADLFSPESHDLL